MNKLRLTADIRLRCFAPPPKFPYGKLRMSAERCAQCEIKYETKARY